jgi:hypothetical protein
MEDRMSKVFNQELKCHLNRMEVDFEDQTCEFYIHSGAPLINMTSYINFATRVDPEVKDIQIFVDEKWNRSFKNYTTGGWRALL